MTNSKLQDMIEKFVCNEVDTYETEYYCSPRQLAQEVMQEFVTFLNDNGVKVKLEEN